MKRKKIALLTVLSISVSTVISCQSITDVSALNNKAALNNGLKTSNILQSGKDILQDEEINCEKESSFSIKAEEKIEVAKGPIVPESNRATSENQDPGEMPRFSKNVKINVPYSVAKTVSPEMRSGSISLTFKDEFKVRFDRDKNLNKEKKFTSSNEEIKEINNLIQEYKVKDVGSFLGSLTQEQADEEERQIEANQGYDFPNYGSKYILIIENINVKEFVDKLRANNLVRQANIPDDVVSTSTPSEPIFVNPKSLLSNGANFSDESIRYWYNRVNHEKASNIAGDKGINPAAVAIIDDGFITGENPAKVIDDIPTFDTTNKAVCDDSANPCKSPSLFNGSTIDYDVEWYYDTQVNKYKDHGIGVASVIGAPAYNNKGTVGLASFNNLNSQNVIIVPVKFKGQASAIAKSIDFIVTNRGLNNVKVINISQGIPDNGIILPVDTNPDVINAISRAYNFGILTVIAAGNTNSPLNTKLSTALVVGGTAKYTNTRWHTPGVNNGSSNYGKVVDMAAPAEEIVIPTRNNTYKLEPGTSLSTPMVAATAALIMGTRNDGKTHLRNGTSVSVDRVKNLLFNSGTLIQTNGALGLRKSNDDYSVPNGSLLNMGRALELAIQLDPAKNYVRLFNTDYYSEAVINSNPSNYLDTYYKEDKIKEVPIGSGRIDFNTFNKSCVYSWGYQLWQQGIVTTERVKGIAGKRKPAKNNGTPAGNVSGSTNISGWDSSGWINQSNSGMTPNSAGEYQAANMYFQFNY